MREANTPEGVQVHWVDGDMHEASFLQIARHDTLAVLKAIRPEGNGNRANIINEWIDHITGERE